MPLTEEERKERKRDYMKKYRKNNKAKIAAQQRKYRIENKKPSTRVRWTEEELKEGRRKSSLKYYLKNKDSADYKARTKASMDKSLAKKRSTPEGRQILRDRNNKWRNNNIEKARESVRDYYRENKDKINAKANKQYADDPCLRKRVSERGKAWYYANQEEYLLSQKIYRESNPEKIKEAKRLFYKQNKDKIIKASKDYYDANSSLLNEKCRERQLFHRENLTDTHICGLMARRSLLTRQHIPQSLIEAKRLEIQMKRYLKEQDNG